LGPGEARPFRGLNRMENFPVRSAPERGNGRTCDRNDCCIGCARSLHLPSEPDHSVSMFGSISVAQFLNAVCFPTDPSVEV
jgi:hypothetical protein